VEARLFDPFFTTKEEGTGLGLAISARIVEKHGGLLRYETELNRGTTFEVVLPAVEDDASEHTID
jgi:signal transduction histidine kinase